MNGLNSINTYRFLPFLFAAAVLAVCVLSVPSVTGAQEIELVNQPVTISGLTGLIATTTPHTMPKGVVEAAVSSLNETSASSEYTINEFPVSITLGVSDSVEVALKGSYLYKEGSPGTGRVRGSGDSEISAKWNMMLQKEGSILPATALFLTALGLTGDKEDGLNRVSTWGARAGLSFGWELSWEDHQIGVYGDAQVVVKDLNRNEYRDRYGVYNAGILLPISKYHNLQLLIEYSGVGGKKFADIDGTDSNTITYGVRMVSERFNLTVGDQMIYKTVSSQKNSGRLIGTLSVKFR